MKEGSQLATGKIKDSNTVHKQHHACSQSPGNSLQRDRTKCLRAGGNIASCSCGKIHESYLMGKGPNTKNISISVAISQLLRFLGDPAHQHLDILIASILNIRPLRSPFSDGKGGPEKPRYY